MNQECELEHLNAGKQSFPLFLETRGSDRSLCESHDTRVRLYVPYM